MAQSVSTLVSSGILTPNKALEDNLRENMELPPITDAEVEEFEAKQLERATQEQKILNPPGEIPGGDEATKVA